jgi:ribosomal-protein-alanine N-acetyltransferase
LANDEGLMGWWGWFVVRKGDEPRLIGVVGTKGPPDSNGIVEVSYGMISSEQQKGYATEATLALMKWVSRDSRTRTIVADTLPHLEASIAVMRKCGLSPWGEGSEPGTIRYGMAKESLQQHNRFRGADPHPPQPST